LNASLAALGLLQDEITVVDHLAQLIEHFSPAALTDINQLQARRATGGGNSSACEAYGNHRSSGGGLGGAGRGSVSDKRRSQKTSPTTDRTVDHLSERIPCLDHAARIS
jgi:hypothetical protein